MIILWCAALWLVAMNRLCKLVWTFRRKWHLPHICMTPAFQYYCIIWSCTDYILFKCYKVGIKFRAHFWLTFCFEKRTGNQLVCNFLLWFMLRFMSTSQRMFDSWITEKKYGDVAEKYRELQTRYFDRSEHWVSSSLLLLL